MFFIMLTFNAQLFSQKLSSNYKNQTLTIALNNLSSRYNLKIAFDTQLADQKIINKTISKASVDETLNILTEGTGMKVQRIGDVYMIIPTPVSQAKKEETTIGIIKGPPAKANSQIVIA